MTLQTAMVNILTAAITNDEAEGKRLIQALSPKERSRLQFYMLRIDHWVEDVEWNEAQEQLQKEREEIINGDSHNR